MFGIGRNGRDAGRLDDELGGEVGLVMTIDAVLAEQASRRGFIGVPREPRRHAGRNDKDGNPDDVPLHAPAARLLRSRIGCSPAACYGACEWPAPRARRIFEAT